jgi:hypothetical protein
MSKKEYEAFVDEDGYTLYVAGMNWYRLFSSMKTDTQLLMIKLLLEDESGEHKVLKRDAKFFDEELKELESKSSSEQIIQTITNTEMDVYEYSAYLLPSKAKLDSLLPTAFTIRCKELEGVINDNFNRGVLTQLYQIAQTKPQYILSIKNNEIVGVSERIIPDIEDHIYSELCKYSD